MLKQRMQKSFSLHFFPNLSFWSPALLFSIKNPPSISLFSLFTPRKYHHRRLHVSQKKNKSPSREQQHFPSTKRSPAPLKPANQFPPLSLPIFKDDPPSCLKDSFLNDFISHEWHFCFLKSVPGPVIAFLYLCLAFFWGCFSLNFFLSVRPRPWFTE